MGSGERSDSLGLAHGERPDQAAIDASGECRLDGGSAAEAATDLQLCRLCLRDRPQQLGVLSPTSAGSSSVEVDHVQPRGTRGRKPLRKCRWPIVKDGDITELSAAQPDDVRVDEIDGWIQLHYATMLTWQPMTHSDWKNPDVSDLCRALGLLHNDDERARFLRDLCTLSELQAMAHRLQVAKLVDAGVAYTEVAERAGGSTTTVTRVSHWLRHGEGGYRLALDRLAANA